MRKKQRLLSTGSRRDGRIQKTFKDNLLHSFTRDKITMRSVLYFSIFFTLAFMTCAALPDATSANTKVIAFAQDTMANDFRKAQVFEVRDNRATKFRAGGALYSNPSFIAANWFQDSPR